MKKHVLGTALFVSSLFLIASCSKTGSNSQTQPAVTLPSIDTNMYLNFVGNSSARCIYAGKSDSVTRGVCWGTSDMPTVAANTAPSLTVFPYEAAMTGLSPSTTYYVRNYATNSAGTVYGKEVKFTTPDSFVIGQFYGGGYICYIDSTKKHGLIVSPTDVSTNATWGCSGTLISGLGKVIGTGSANTAAIIAKCPDPGAAATICKHLNTGGYTDWYLPSQYELATVFAGQFITTGINENTFYIKENNYYWCSTENSTTNAEAFVLLYNSTTGYYYTAYQEDKGTAYYVRAVRSF